MAESWVRLWHDMPTDPKWRTIARSSKQPVSLVISVFTFLMVDASRNVTRGHVTVTRGHVTVTAEDLASALDVTEEEIEAVLSAMQGRVMDGNTLTGWDARQPKREDAGNHETGAKSATERKREQRERERLAAEKAGVTESHNESREVTTDKDSDKDSDKEVNQKQTVAPSGAQVAAAPEHSDGEPGQQTGAENGSPAEPKAKTVGAKALVADGVDRKVAEDWLLVRKQKRSPLTETAWAATKSEIAKAGLSVGDGVRICAERAWVGFRADWLRNPAHPAAKPSRPSPRSMHDIPKDFSGYPASSGIAIDPNDKFEDVL